MFSQIAKRASVLFNPSSKSAFASTQGGNLYTWGAKSAGLGLTVVSGSEEAAVPHRVEEFHNNVVKVAMGPSHTAVVTNDGELYTFGWGAHGVLGHGTKDIHSFTPQLVQYFNDNNIRVKDVAVGKHHTAALTTNGEVYTWGFGGKSMNFLKNMFNPSYGALGQGSNSDMHYPTLIEDAKFGADGSLASGYNFVALLNGQSELYNWGIGKGAVFAEGAEDNLKVPTLNEAMQHVVEEEGSKIVKIKAAANHIMVLLENGSLYGWGENQLGQLGVKKSVGIEINHEIDHPTKLETENINGKVVDFDSGEQISIILTDSGEAYWFGLKLALQAEQIILPKGVKAKKVAIANPFYIVVAENNDVYSNTAIVPDAEFEPLTGNFKIKAEHFGNGQVLEVGGQYENRYAIVKN